MSFSLGRRMICARACRALDSMLRRRIVQLVLFLLALAYFLLVRVEIAEAREATVFSVTSVVNQECGKNVALPKKGGATNAGAPHSWHLSSVAARSRHLLDLRGQRLVAGRDLLELHDEKEWVIAAPDLLQAGDHRA
jgi:hypothetical protein